MQQEPSTISNEAAAELGVSTRHELMANGEQRFRLTSDDGSSYIRTVSEVGGWQSSHYHVTLLETYILQAGNAALAELIDGKLDLNWLHPGDVRTMRPGVHHNVYMAPGAVMHTVKHGVGGSADWHASDALDALTKTLSDVGLAATRRDGRFS
jgi:hypothetical protein